MNGPKKLQMKRAGPFEIEQVISRTAFCLRIPPQWKIHPIFHTSLLTTYKETVTVEEPPIPFSPFSLADCTMLNHFSFNDFIAIAFPDIAGDLDAQI